MVLYPPTAGLFQVLHGVVPTNYRFVSGVTWCCTHQQQVCFRSYMVLYPPTAGFFQELHGVVSTNSRFLSGVTWCCIHQQQVCFRSYMVLYPPTAGLFQELHGVVSTNSRFLSGVTWCCSLQSPHKIMHRALCVLSWLLKLSPLQAYPDTPHSQFNQMYLWWSSCSLY